MTTSILHRELNAIPRTAVIGRGIHLYDDAGKPYIDASGGAAVSCLGHSHPAVIEALCEQLSKLSYAHTSFFTTEPAEKSNTLGALSISGNPQRRSKYEPLLGEGTWIAPCHPYRFKQQAESGEAYGLRVANELEDAIVRLGPENVAAFIAEPVVGTTLGCVPAVPGYFRRIRDICTRYGVLLIADEVMCGFGRTGTLFAIEAEGVCPDIVTVSKGLGGGYQPIAATLASGLVADALASGSGKLANGHTYMGHALACAASLAVLETINAESLLARVQQRGEHLRNALVETFGDRPYIGDIRGRGLFQAIEIVQDRREKLPFARAAQIAERLKTAALSEGLICYPGTGCADGTLGDHVLLAPPYIVEKDDIEEIVRRLDAAITATVRP